MGDFSWKAARRKYGVVVYNYTTGGVKGCLPLEIGECVHILEEYCTGSGADRKATWYRGYSFHNRKAKGIFPASFVHLKECNVENEGPYESVIPIEDAIIKEVTFVLREWNLIWKQLFVEDSRLFGTITTVMVDLMNFRCQLVANTLTNDQCWDLKEQIISRIDWGNGKLGLDLVPRRDGKQVDPDNCSFIELYRLHSQSMEASKGTSPRRQTIRDKARSSREKVASSMAHLVLSFKSLACNVGDESETYFSLYDSSTNKFISEKFLVRNTNKGMPVNMEKLHNYRGIFMDLNEADLERELYLVAQIFRSGRMLQESSSKKIPKFHYRRPWGAAVLYLKDVLALKREEELDFQMKVQSCVESESSFPHLHETLIKKQSMMIGKGFTIEKDKQTIGIAVSMKLLHGDLTSVKAEQPIMFSKGITMIQKIGFSDSINPGEVRNDLYLTLVNSEFDRGSKKAAKNVEVTVTVFDSNGDMIPECITGGCGEDAVTKYFSSIFYHNNNPKWNDTIRLSIPIDKFQCAHIRFEFCHCSTRDKTEKQLYGFSYLSLNPYDSATQADGTHALCIYKCDNASKIRNYMKLPSFQEDFNDPKIMSTLPNQLPYNRSSKEYLTVSTFLCSTKFTQQADLVRVFQSSSRQECIEKSLHNLINLRGQEVVRYLQDILDALFYMYGHTSSEGERFKHAAEVFHALVHIFNLLQDSKFEKFVCVLEAYLEENFSYPLAYRDLLSCLHEKTELAVSCADFDKEYTVEDVFQVLEQIFRFIEKSYRLFQGQYGVEPDNFKQLLGSVFRSYGRIMSSTEVALRRAQAKLLRELNKTFQPLLKLITRKELAGLIQEMCSKMPKELPPLLLEAKLQLCRDMVNSVLFTEQVSRDIVLPMCMSVIKKCLITKRVLPLASQTLGDILDQFREISVPDGDSQYVLKILFDLLMQTLLIMDEVQQEEAGGMMICCLMELLRKMEELHYTSLMNTYPKGRPLKDFLIRVLLVFRDLIKRDVFPASWTLMRMVTNHVILTAIQYVAQSLTEHFLTGSDFDNQLWSNYFDLAVSFVTQDSLQLERFSDAKRNKVKDRYQDMRVLIGLQIQTLWNGLGNQKRHFIPSLVGPFLEVTMVPETDVRKATIPIFFDMMLCEQNIKGNFTSVESEIIEKLDILITGNNGDTEYRTLFNQILLDKVQTEPVLREDGRRFVVSVTNLLEKLLDYRQVIEGDEHRDKRMHCTFNILNFYKDNINREEMYIRYINKLFILHHDANNFVEAGLTLQLYAQLLRWTPDQLSANLGYPSQKELERKEELTLKVIECFDKGKAWEYGIPLCKELAEVYEKKLFNYKKLSQILQREAAFFNNILEGPSLRQNPSYYRVAYYGMSFPPFVRNKEFVYRGDECLKLATIMSHLTTEFPSASILTSNTPPDDKVREGDQQCIQISSVKPVASERSEFQGHTVPMEISNFYSVNEVDVFQFDRPYHRGERNKDNEFKTLCLERKVLKTSYKLPGILRWYEVVQTEVLHLPPILVAVENMRTVNTELDYLTGRCKSNTDMFFQQLMMRLQGVINSVVNGGLPKYQEAFFCDEFASKHPDEVCHLIELKTLLVEQVDLMEQGLRKTESMCTEEMKPLQKNLVEMFSKLKQDITDSGSPRAGRLRGGSLGAVIRPGTPGSGSLNSSSSNRSSITSAEAMSQDGDNIYMDPPEDSGMPPPPPEKRRIGSRLANYGAHLGGQQAPPIPSRPASALVSGSALQQLTSRLQQSRGVTGSDPALNQSPTSQRALSSSMSSSNLGSGSRTPDAQNMRRFVSSPDTSNTDPSTPPPLPQRRTSNAAEIGTGILNTRPPPPPPRQTTHDLRFLSYNVPSPTSGNVTPVPEEKPAIPSRTRSIAVVNGSFDQGLTAVREQASGEDKIPPLPPRVPPRPSIPSLPEAGSPSQPPANENITSPPPVPKRTSMYRGVSSGSVEDTHM
ncbi:dedicator of cytokinesis protein 3-like isoform X2 [Haliotis rufescens]|uniref:dedicator of cytokinesis protein 3-like isoform X2 n=1 Tax=Haliotis rufescens TaxID=6454 RepID=UPI00201FB271|nr:dedicator of cytokinesis protein 3-like isoform X2 [Haliotis rufescens]